MRSARACAATNTPAPSRRVDVARALAGASLCAFGFAAGLAPAGAALATESGPPGCPPSKLLEAPVDPGLTYLRPVGRIGGYPTYVHVTKADMPWRIAVARPKEAPRFGSTKDARQGVIEAIRLWEDALVPFLPWFRLEFVERDEAAPVQVV